MDSQTRPNLNEWLRRAGLVLALLSGVMLISQLWPARDPSKPTPRATGAITVVAHGIEQVGSIRKSARTSEAEDVATALLDLQAGRFDVLEDAGRQLRGTRAGIVWVAFDLLIADPRNRPTLTFPAPFTQVLGVWYAQANVASTPDGSARSTAHMPGRLIDPSRRSWQLDHIQAHTRTTVLVAFPPNMLPALHIEVHDTASFTDHIFWDAFSTGLFVALMSSMILAAWLQVRETGDRIFRLWVMYGTLTAVQLSSTGGLFDELLTGDWLQAAQAAGSALIFANVCAGGLIALELRRPGWLDQRWINAPPLLVLLLIPLSVSGAMPDWLSQERLLSLALWGSLPFLFGLVLVSLWALITERSAVRRLIATLFLGVSGYALLVAASLVGLIGYQRLMTVHLTGAACAHFLAMQAMLLLRARARRRRFMTERAQMVRQLSTYNRTLENRLSARPSAEVNSGAVPGDSRGIVDSMALAAHELRTPAATIRTALGSLQIMLAGESTEIQTRLQRIQNACDRITALCDRFIADRRLREARLSVQRQAIDVVALIKAFIVQRDASDRILLHADAAAIPMYSDPLLLGLAIENLIDNALRHQPHDAGPIEITLSQHPRGTDNPQPLLRLCISDRGCGIEAEEFERLLAPFAKQPVDVRDFYHGVGLSIVQRALTAISGALSHSNRPDGGSVFTVTLPLDAEQAVAVQ